MTAQTTLSRLKSAMATKGDFPSVASTVASITAAMRAEDATDEALVQAVLADFALTNKVLRLANSAMYSGFGGSVTTVSKAVFMLGTETVGHLALGLRLIDNLGQAARTDAAKAELSKAVMAGTVARSLVAELSVKDAEEVAVASLLRALGRLLVCFYLPDVHAHIEQRGGGDIDIENEVTTGVMGLTYSDLATHVASQWSLPAELLANLADPGPDADMHAAWVHAVAGYSRRFVDLAVAGASQEELAVLAGRFTQSTGMPAEQLLSCASSSFESEECDAARTAAMPLAGEVHARPSSGARTALQALATGLQEVKEVEPSMRTPQLTAMVMEVLWKALGATRVLFFLRKPARKRFEFMLGVGEVAVEQSQQLAFEEAFSPNVFHFALSNSVPVYLANITEPNIARRIPPWFQQHLPSTRSMLLMSVQVAKQPVGLLYLDWGQVGREAALEPAEMSYVESLRAILQTSFAQGARTSAPLQQSRVA